MSNVIRSLKESMQSALRYIDVLEKEARSRGLANEQFFINWQDELNAISVR